MPALVDGDFRLTESSAILKYLADVADSSADHLGASFVTVGEAIGCDFAAYPNVRRWRSRAETTLGAFSIAGRWTRAAPTRIQAEGQSFAARITSA